ncbi:MAG: TetR/AcrR family transcriptional regulator [Rhodoglobus sp.]
MANARAQRERAVRSDSLRNREAILEAAAGCLADKPTATLADIAQAAGIGRVTLYGHFSSRSELLAALLHHTMERVESELAAVDLDGDTWAALDALAGSSWELVYSFDRLRGVVELALSGEQMHDSHDRPRERVVELLVRGRAEGSFRSDHSVEWQVAAYFALLHGVASEIRSGRLTEREVREALPQTLRAILQTPPAS